MPKLRARTARLHRAFRRAQVAALALVGVALSLAAFRIAAQADFERVKSVLELRAEWRARDMERKLAVADRDADALTIYVAAQPRITAARFHNFARLMHDRTDFASALYWSPWIDAADRADFVGAARREVDPAFDIREIDATDRFVPAAARAAYLPELYEETFDATPGTIGFDLMFRDERKLQAEAARDGGQPVASAPFSMLIGGTRLPGFIVFWPVYATGTVPPTKDARRETFRGITTVRFRFDRVLPGLLVNTPDIIEAMDISVGQEGAIPRYLAAYDPAVQRFTIGGTPPPTPAGGLTLERDFSVLHQHWQIRSHFSRQTIAALTSSAPWTWLIFGLLSTASFSVYAARQTARLGEVEVIASETDDRFRRMFDENPIGMVLATAEEYRFVRVNAAFCRMLGYAPEELVGRLRGDFAGPDSQNIPTPGEVGVDPGWHAEDKHYTTKSGAVITARVRIIRLAPTAAGEALILGLTEDVTEQRQLEAALRQSQKMEAIGQLTGGMAHDFNNLLGIIIGNLDLLEPRVQDHAEASELLEEALGAAARGADLTRRLLAFARRQPLNPHRIAVNNQVTEVARLLARTLGEQVQISLDLSADVWPVLADAAQLEAGIINLATNARDAMPSGGTLTIGTANRQLDAAYAATHADVAAGDYVMIEITDTGTGIPPDILARIFEPFFTTKEPGKGTGLGLSMVFGFLKQSNGHISAYSELGVGTTFRLYLPRAGQDAEEQKAAPMPTIPHGAGEAVLVVEDNEPLRRLALRQLSDLGYVVSVADSSAAALEILAHASVALVMTDIVMPGDMDGFGLAHTILHQWPATKLLLTSGFPQVTLNERFGEYGASLRLLSKPYRAKDLANVVRELLTS